ncbi:MAG: hypothetical protein UY04_C0010G0027 [Parcubacteria group bacterium GW2011_GWA2_47_7]|nr:MAG: hypothetical protein UY04_C0010G0027 [Parcubacteria group bacterium GW2011_GWA2_47_7]
MKSRHTEKGYLILIEPGEEIVSTISAFVVANNIAAGTFTAIGAVSSVDLGYYELAEKEYHWKNFQGTIEIASGIGNIAWLDDDTPIVHFHGVFSGSDFVAFAGHVRHAIVSAACEVVLIDYRDRLLRKMDKTIGLNLWECDKKN